MTTGSIENHARLVINGRFLTQDVTGVQRVAIELTREIDLMLESGELKGIDVEVLVPPVALVTELQLKRIKLRRIGVAAPLIWEQVSLPIAARGAAILCLGNLAPLLSLIRRRQRTFTVIHDLSYRYFPHAYRRLFRWLHRLLIPCVLALSTEVFTVSESEARAIRFAHPRNPGARRLRVLQNGGGEQPLGRAPSRDSAAATSGAVAVPSIDTRDRSLLYVGSLTKRKNAAALEQLAAVFARESIDFVFVGSTGGSFTATGRAESSASGRIHRLGQINDRGELERRYRAARVFVFPSFYEASPLPVIEAMSLGCPVVAADIPSLRERCGDAALFCDPNDVRQFEDAIRRVLEDDALAATLQERGLRRAAEFTWERQARSLVSSFVSDLQPPVSARRVDVVHETNPEKYFPALYELARRGSFTLTTYRYSALKEWARAYLIDRTPAALRTRHALADFLYRFRVPFIRDRAVVLGFAPWTYRLLWYLALARRNRIVYHTSWHDWQPSAVPRRYGFVTPILIRVWRRFLESEAVRIVAVSRVSADSVARFSGKGAVVIPHAVPEVFFAHASEPDTEDRPLRILFVGELSSKKGVPELTRLVEEWSGPPIALTVVGAGPAAGLVAAAAARSEHISALGAIKSRDELARVMSGHDILVLPSKRQSDWEEVFGIVVIEAAAAGLGVIATDHVGPRAILGDLALDNLIPDGDIEGFRQRIAELAENPVDRAHFRKAHAAAAQPFRLESVAAAWEEILRD
ncbi:glycosyltransferase [Microbacterium aurantiacum]|uniref:glycosyltransferase n=1 Tax=Microbacterium aurantiacum TaxID=162393 RepID=UPI003D712EED